MTSGSLSQQATGNAMRRYRFAEHGVSNMRRRRPRNEDRSNRQQPSRRRPPPYLAHDVQQFDLSEFSNADRLGAVFRILRAEGGHAPGIDGISYDDFSGSELFEALRQLSACLVEKEYLPEPTRLVEIPKGDGRFRQLHLNCILDRVVAKALQLALDPFWRARLPRLGKSVPDLYAQMQRFIRRHSAYFLFARDIRNCFPTAPLDAVMDCHRRHLDHPDLLWLIETVVRGHDGLGHPTGLYQGSPYSPVAMELLLHILLDVRLDANFNGSPSLFRYVDNLNIVGRDERECCLVMQSSAETLAESGFRLKPETPPMDHPMDLRMADPNRVVLGLNPSWVNGQLHFTVPESAFEDLSGKLAIATTKSRPLEIARQIMGGWLWAMGPALTNAARPAVVDRVMAVARECGFPEFRSRDFRDVTSQARQSWLSLAQTWEGRANG